MKVYDDTAEAIVLKLKAVAGIGKVFQTPKRVTDMKTLEDLYTVPHPRTPEEKILCVAWLTRIAQGEDPSWSDDSQQAGVTATSRWQVTLLYQYEDDDEPERTSEVAFQNLVDAVLEEFRLDGALEAEGVTRTWPMSAESLTVGTMEGGSTLAHRAVLILRVEHFITE